MYTKRNQNKKVSNQKEILHPKKNRIKWHYQKININYVWYINDIRSHNHKTETERGYDTLKKISEKELTRNDSDHLRKENSETEAFGCKSRQ